MEATHVGLGLLAKAFLWLGAPAAIIALAVNSPPTASILPIVLLPTIWALYKHRSLPAEQRVDPSHLALIFWTVGTIGVVSVISIQALACYGVATLLFGTTLAAKDYMAEFGRSSVAGLTVDELGRRAELAHSWRHFAMLLFFTYVVAGGAEELLKFAPIAFLRSRQPDRMPMATKAKRYMQYAIAAGLGFSTTENVGFIMVAINDSHSVWKVALTVLERVLSGGPGHVLCACLSAINAARLDHAKLTPRTLWQIVGLSAFYHGTFDFMLFAITAWNGNVGWIHPTDAVSLVTGALGVVALQGTLALQVGQRWSA